MPFAVWITGLPGSGKTTIANELKKILRKEKIRFEYLSMDKLRKKFAEKTAYTAEERDSAYKKFADIGINKIKKNKNVTFDATAHKRKYRDYAREKIRNFVEVYIKCPLKACIKRESKRRQGLVIAKLYKKALERKNKNIAYKGLGSVVGVDVPYEESKPELAIYSNKIRPNKAACKISLFLKNKNLI